MAIATASPPNEELKAGFGARMPFEAIQSPGCYVCHWSGHLLRVPQNAVAPVRARCMSMSGRERLFVTHISDDPYESITRARELARRCQVPVRF